MERTKQKPPKYIQLMVTGETFRRVSSDDLKGVFKYVNDREDKPLTVVRQANGNGSSFFAFYTTNLPLEFVAIPRYKYVQENRGYLPSKFTEQKPHLLLKKSA